MTRSVVRLRLLDGAIQLAGGVLVPFDGGPPTRTVGTTVAKASAVLDVGQAPVDRCLASRAIAPEVLAEIVSPTYARNLRRVGRRVHPSLVDACRELPMRVLLDLAAHEDLPDQREFLRTWEASQIERAGRPHTRVGERRARRAGPLGVRKRRTLQRLVDEIGARELRRLIGEL